MPFTSATRDAILDGSSVDELCTHASLHTADPGGTGANELSGGSYTRVPIAWAQASGGSKTITGVATFQIPGGVNFTHFGLQSASSGGTFRGGDVLSQPQSYSTPGTFDLTITVNSA